MTRAVTLNLGAGVQSTALLLMAAHGHLERAPDVAVFSDTHDEPEAVYRHLEWLEERVAELTGGRLRIVRTSAGPLGEHLMAAAAGTRKRASNPPLFTRGRRACRACEGTGKPPAGDGTVGLFELLGTDVCPSCDGTGREELESDGLLPRGCTRDYKIRPIRRALRELGYGPANPVTTYLGLSFDELERIKPSDVKWQELAYPLIDARITRQGCIEWLEERGYPEPPRSACVYCPHHSNAEWRRIRDEDPAGWARALEVDEAVRTGLPGLEGTAYLHRQRVPLVEAELEADDVDQLRMDECEGGCFV